MNLKTVSLLFITLLSIWLTVSLWVQSFTNSYTIGFNIESNFPKALVVFDDDPLSDFDENICYSFANGLAQQNWSVTISSVNEACRDSSTRYNLYVLCANTYNFAPDWAISHYIHNGDHLQNTPVVAITLGAGTTQRAQRLLEENLKNKGADLIDSHVFWLMRPNDDTRLEDSNVQVALEMAFEKGKNTSNQFFPNTTMVAE